MRRIVWRDAGYLWRGFHYVKHNQSVCEASGSMRSDLFDKLGKNSFSAYPRETSTRNRCSFFLHNRDRKMDELHIITFKYTFWQATKRPSYCIDVFSEAFKFKTILNLCPSNVFPCIAIPFYFLSLDLSLQQFLR